MVSNSDKLSGLFPIRELLKELYQGEIESLGFELKRDAFSRKRKEKRYLEGYRPMILWDWDRQRNAELQLWVELEFLDLPASTGPVHTGENAHWATQAHVFVDGLKWEWEYAKRDDWKKDIPNVRKSISTVIRHVESKHEALRLVKAAEKGFHKELDRLLESGVDPNEGGNVLFTPLMAAASKGDLIAVKRLLGAGVDPNKRIAAGGYTALNVAYSSACPYDDFSGQISPAFAAVIDVLKTAMGIS